MTKYILFIASILLLFSWNSNGQICATSTYLPGDSPRQVQQNAAGNYLILSRNKVIELPPDLAGGQSFYISPFYYQYLREVEDGYLLAGYNRNAGSSLVYSTLNLQKTTKQGEIIWNHPDVEFTLEFNETICTGFGLTDMTGASFIASRRKIYRMDNLGNAFDTVWVNTTGMDEFSFVTRVDNGDFVALARRYSDYNHWQAYQLRFDSDLNFQTSKLVDFSGDSEYAFLSVEAVLPNGDWLLLGKMSDGYKMLRLDAAGDLLWKQEDVGCEPGFPCADVITDLVPIGDFIWRMEVTADNHPQILRCNASGEVVGKVDFGLYNSMYGQLKDAVSGTATDKVLLVGYERTGTPGNYTSTSIAVLLHCENTTGYIDHELATNVVVFPNPAQQSFKVQLPLSGNYRLSLHDATGRSWKNQIFTSESTVVDCSELPAGLYFLSIEEKGGSVYRKVVTLVR